MDCRIPVLPRRGGERSLFDPSAAEDKSPFGAVRTGTVLSFRLHPAAALRITGAALHLFCSFADRWEHIPLTDEGEEHGEHIFRCRYAAPEVGELIFYHFLVFFEDGSERISDAFGFCENREIVPFQQTVYAAARPCPSWYGEGVSYQIFPDRFYRSGEAPELRGMIGKRVLHERWGETPVAAPREDEPRWCYDFFGGNLRGITEKLGYLSSLSVRTVYLCPIFESSSNHRYNTGDYRRIDPMLGDEEDFRTLCREAKARGIRIMLDGVFSHTGHDSRYFNALGCYPDLGAAQSETSPYRDWYRFSHWPDSYECWWGIPSLPNTEELHPGFSELIADGEDSVIRHWLRAGASAWRLDVADELPDRFIEKIRDAMESTDSDSFLLGEVWEDASNKISYGERRRYLLGDECHAVMNYPFRSAALAFLRGGRAEDFYERMETLREHYPPEAFANLMNFLSTHDTPRILTLLGADEGELPTDRAEQAHFRLSPAQRALAEQRLRVGAVLLYAFPGSPLLYYGDEAGTEGLDDPFNRGCYPWGNEDAALLAFYRRLGALRAERKSLQRGTLRYLAAKGSLLVFERRCEDERTLALLNAGGGAEDMLLPWAAPLATDALSGQQFLAENGAVSLTLPPRSALLLC